MATLKNCPRCGHKPEYILVGDYLQYYIVACVNCGYVAASKDEARNTKWGARRLWNRKVADFKGESK